MDQPPEPVTITWHDRGRAPQHPPNPAYPEGVDLDVTGGLGPLRRTCTVALPYPAPRCGLYVITCRRCTLRVAVTTAGRPDDPRSVRLPCKRDADAREETPHA